MKYDNKETILIYASKPGLWPLCAIFGFYVNNMLIIISFIIIYNFKNTATILSYHKDERPLMDYFKIYDVKIEMVSTFK